MAKRNISKPAIVYKITHRESGKAYIGATPHPQTMAAQIRDDPLPRANLQTGGELAEMQKKFGIGSKPAKSTANLRLTSGGFNPTPEQVAQIGELHQQHVVAPQQGKAPVPSPNGAINPTPQEQAALAEMQKKFGVGSKPGKPIANLQEASGGFNPTPEQVQQIAALHQEQAELAEMQKKFGVGSKPEGSTANLRSSLGGFNPTPEQAQQIGELHQQHVLAKGNGPVLVLTRADRIDT
jgi:Spy/CpxP family protein refolding chaperone